MPHGISAYGKILVVNLPHGGDNGGVINGGIEPRKEGICIA